MSLNQDPPYFFFGTLMDAEVRELVLGRPSGSHAVEPAVLRGFLRYRVVDESYPTLRPRPGECIDGLVMRGLSEGEQRRVAFFEGAEYSIEERPVSLADGRLAQARLFLDPGELQIAEPWDYSLWQRRDKPALLEAARRFMAGFGVSGDRTAIDARWRAAWLKARGLAPRD